MTALSTFPFGLEFDFDFGRKVVEKTDKLSTQITNTLLESLMSDKSVAHEVERKFDFEICQINEQLEGVKGDYNKIAADMEQIVVMLHNSYNEKPNRPESFFDLISFVSNLALGFISIAHERVASTLEHIHKSEIDRASLFLTVDYLEGIKKSIEKIGACYEEMIDAADIYKALHEKSKEVSAHPELNALLG